jgi:hypothetical protein
VAIIIPIACVARVAPKTLARSKGGLPSSSNSALAKTPFKARTLRLVKGP